MALSRGVDSENHKWHCQEGLILKTKNGTIKLGKK